MVTSGRLTGASRVQAARTRGSPKSRLEPAYSLYSTDSEDQVATLHKGLDRCAALLSDLLQCDNQDAVPKQDRAVKNAVPKCRPHTPTGKKAIRRSLSKSVPNPRGAQAIRRKSTTKPVTTTPQRSPAPPHYGVKLQPPVRKTHPLKTPSKASKSQALSSPVPPAQTHTGLDCVPERDQGPTGVSREGEEEEEEEEEEGKMARVKCLLGELRTLMVGRGDSAQTYLHLLEQTMSSALSSENIKNQGPSSSQNQDLSTSKGQIDNTDVQVERQVKSLNQQLQDQEATQQLLNSQVLSLQGQLSAAEKETAQARKSLQETERRLQSREEESIGLKTELESTRGRLRATLQDKFKLEGMLQQKQQEVETLHRIIDSLDSSTPTPDNQPACPPGPAREHITQYLLSLQRSQPAQPPCPSGSDQGPIQGPEHDVDSVISDWSVQSESSFNTRDEAAFRDGLAALDASIASLQKTLKMDLVNT